MFADRYFGKRYFGNRYFGPHGADVDSLFKPGGGYYRKPIKYVRDGKIVDLDEPRPAPELVEWPAVAPEIVAALLAGFQAPPIELPDAAALERRLGRMVIDREMAAMRDDDDAVLLLLTS
ncbi:hypothetical protein EN745_26905 [Mesorhizobium sp. M4A.F.Ca.ET.022.05.2.1]|uniref:hypothetical protein n=1 Tax=Mesorhizobium sp. M4A.F.Ca.ET.022.05.2.1 TaxID=2496653 RepID=UPI000FC9DF6D|nr:hypothetical protein [Mesorhizobium sp. M4A.F.Ca.ET.022.05.2.1]RVC75653.1 hypothetical protein EN745_26905 [Mesorhizobium sp. M4A.F.Ca.ET.022.05.2.1]